MRFFVTHDTRYRYSQSVFLEPLTIRLRPRVDYRQRLLEFSLNIDPVPAHLFESIDLEGNQIASASFRESTAFLEITTSFVAETSSVNPFGFLVRSDATRLSLRPGDQERTLFDAYARLSSPPAEVADLAHRIAQAVDHQTVAFATRLNEWIYESHEKIVRPHGPAWPSGETVRERRGSCRDLAVLFIDACRVMNLPSRFVSGYGANTDESNDEQQLHAWAEVYLPGAGWRGFDPSLGLAVADCHLAVATGVTPAAAAPTAGHFRGDAASDLEVSVTLETSLDSSAHRRSSSQQQKQQ